MLVDVLWSSSYTPKAGFRPPPAIHSLMVLLDKHVGLSIAAVPCITRYRATYGMFHVAKTGTESNRLD